MDAKEDIALRGIGQYIIPFHLGLFTEWAIFERESDGSNSDDIRCGDNLFSNMLL